MPSATDDQYNQTIDVQKAHLSALYQAFTQECDAIKREARARLEKVPAGEKEARRRIGEEGRARLQDAIYRLRTAIRESSDTTLQKLEALQRQREAEVLRDIERRLQAL